MDYSSKKNDILIKLKNKLENDSYVLTGILNNTLNKTDIFNDIYNDQYNLQHDSFIKASISTYNMGNIYIKSILAERQSLISTIKQYLSANCNHNWETDLIDITSDRSQIIQYCLTCGITSTEEKGNTDPEIHI